MLPGGESVPSSKNRHQYGLKATFSHKPIKQQLYNGGYIFGASQLPLRNDLSEMVPFGSIAFGNLICD